MNDIKNELKGGFDENVGAVVQTFDGDGASSNLMRVNLTLAPDYRSSPTRFG